MPGEQLAFRFDGSTLLMMSRRISAKMATDFKQATKSVHEEAALRIQQGMVDRLEKQVKSTRRNQRGTQYLERSLLNPRNVSVTQRGFGVLKASYMDRSPAALYWRRIEEGDQTTFSGYILFTNDIQGGKRYGPWSPGGRRTRMIKGRPVTTANDAPPGYKHMRMPQHRGVYVQGIGPFPAYHFTEGGAVALRNFPFFIRYKKALTAVGLDLEAFVR